MGSQISVSISITQLGFTWIQGYPRVWSNDTSSSHSAEAKLFGVNALIEDCLKTPCKPPWVPYWKMWYHLCNKKFNNTLHAQTDTFSLFKCYAHVGQVCLVVELGRQTFCFPRACRETFGKNQSNVYLEFATKQSRNNASSPTDRYLSVLSCSYYWQLKRVFVIPHHQLGVLAPQAALELEEEAHLVAVSKAGMPHPMVSFSLLPQLKSQSEARPEAQNSADGLSVEDWSHSLCETIQTLRDVDAIWRERTPSIYSAIKLAISKGDHCQWHTRTMNLKRRHHLEQVKRKTGQM